MKYNFKQIFALGTSALLIGMTAMMGVGAVNYPQPFVVGGAGDVAIVYGTGSGVSSLDLVQAGNIQTDLGIGGTTVSVEGGEAFPLDKSSNHFNFNDALNSIYTTLSDSHMDILADVTYDDGNIDEDYSQKIILGEATLGLFQDIDVNDDKPTLGFDITDGDKVLDYVIDFDSGILYSEMNATYMPLFGNEYYVLDADADQIDVLDTSEIHSLNVGETRTIGDRSVALTYVDKESAKFTIDGENTDSLSVNEEYKLGDDSYIVVTDISYQDYSGGIQAAEFAIGNGKLTLHDGGTDEVELNDEDVDGLFADFTDDAEHLHLDKLTLTWKVDDDTFLTEGNSITMPGFETISLFYNGLDFPSDSETISLDNGEKLTLTMDNYDLKVMYHGVDANDIRLGEKGHELILATTSVTFADAGYVVDNVTGSIGDWDIALNDGTTAEGVLGDTEAAALAEEYLATALPIDKDQRFLVTRIKDDITDLETLYYEVDKLDADDSTTILKLDDKIEDNDIEFSDIGDEEDRGDVTIKLADFDTAKDTAYLTFTASTDTMTYDKAVSETGLVVTLPAKGDVELMESDGDPGVDFLFTEANDEDDLNKGIVFEATVKANTDGNLFVSGHNVTDFEESNDYEIGYVNSALVSKTMFDTSGDENDFSIEYYGEEVTADVQVIVGGEVTSEPIGSVLVKDTEVSSVSSKNLIVVGGSCINSVAANLVGGAYCGSSWTDETNVGSGQFLIQSFGDAYTTGKIALLVAGYDVSDTVNAATYLRTQTVDTTADKKYIGTTSTQATLQVE